MESGAIPLDCGNAPDDPVALEAALRRCLEADLIVTTGGVSVGDFDFVKQAYESVGSALDFWKVRIKPGKPLAFGQIGGKPAFGLPGNPVSCMVNFTRFVRPVIQQMLGASKAFTQGGHAGLRVGSPSSLAVSPKTPLKTRKSSANTPTSASVAGAVGRRGCYQQIPPSISTCT